MLDGTPRTTKEEMDVAPARLDPAVFMGPRNPFSEAAVAMAASWMAPFAVASEMTAQARRVRGLSLRWSQALTRCRTMNEVVETNARFGEEAIAIGYSGAWRVLERSTVLARRSVSPRAFAERNRGAD